MNTENSPERVIQDLRTRLAAAEKTLVIWKWATLFLLAGPAALYWSLVLG